MTYALQAAEEAGLDRFTVGDSTYDMGPQMLAKLEHFARLLTEPMQARVAEVEKELADLLHAANGRDAENMREINEQRARIAELEESLRISRQSEKEAWRYKDELKGDLRKAEKRAGVPNSVFSALQYYADGDHFLRSDEDAWDTVSGEPQNLWCDEAGTATVEDGTLARAALNELLAAAPAPVVAGEPLTWINEDELPESYPYDAMFPHSKVDVVRMFPVYGPPVAAGEPVGVAGSMPGTAGFTMACFKASDVPLGTNLYTAPVAAPAPKRIDKQALPMAVIEALNAASGGNEWQGDEPPGMLVGAAVAAIARLQSSAAPAEAMDAPPWWEREVVRLTTVLQEIGDLAHEKLMSPDAVDFLWEIRGMAYDAMAAQRDGGAV